MPSSVNQAPRVSLNRKFLADRADVSLELTSPALPALAKALVTPGAPMPGGELSLGDIKANVEGGGPITLASAAAGPVALSGHAESSFHVGVYLDPAAAVKAIAPSPELADGLTVEEQPATRYAIVRGSYDLRSTARGALGLGAGVSGSFGVDAASRGLFAVMHRFHDSEPALQVLQDTFHSCALPRSLERADDLAPATWLISEVEGGVALQLGIQAGYDFSWVRTIADGALAGDIGLRVQAGATAVLGLQASGKYLLVVGREHADDALRLRLFKLAKKGWEFALDSRVGVQATLPPFFDRAHKPEALVAAVFGLDEHQVFDVLRDTRAFVEREASLEDKLAGLLMHLGGRTLEAAAGLGAEDVRAIYETGRARLEQMLVRFDALLSSAGHRTTSLLLSLTHGELAQLRPVLAEIARAGSDGQVQAIVRGLVSRAGFERTPLARVIEAAAGPALGLLRRTDLARRVRELAARAVDALEGDTLQAVLDYIRERVNLAAVQQAVDRATFDRMDRLLKDRLAAFLGKQTVLMEDLARCQLAIKTLLEQADTVYAAALAAVRRQHEFAFAATYARSTAKTALLDITFDLSKAGVGERLQRAIAGELDDLLLAAPEGVTLHAAELTHNLARDLSPQVSMPFGTVSDALSTFAHASLSIVEDAGRVLVYTLAAEDQESERTGLLRARSGRDSTLTVAASLPVGVAGGLKVWRADAFGYTHRMEHAVRRMRLSQLIDECEPLLEKYTPHTFLAPAARGFREWAADLDKLLDGKDPHSGTHDIGDTLIGLTVVASAEHLKAWTNAPASPTHPVYKELSRALQRALKELVSFYAFADPARYRDLAVAAPALVFACMRPATSVERRPGGHVRFDQGGSVYWDSRDPRQLRAILSARETQFALASRMRSIAAMLREIPGLAGTAQFYRDDQLDEVIAAALRAQHTGHTIPEQLGALLALEDALVTNAVRSGVEMGRFRESAAEAPAEAIEHLARFGEDLARTFNSALAQNPFLSGAARALGTVLFVEASAVFDPAVKARPPAALLDITVVKSGVLSVDEMLTGKVTDDLVLYEQRFVEA
jgi:hypothetical protein